MELKTETFLPDKTQVIFLFQIAAEVSAPLAKTDEIVLIGGQDRTTAEISKLCGTLPPAVQALTGVDITGVGVIDMPVVTRQPVSISDVMDTTSDNTSSTRPRPQRTPSVKRIGSFHMH